MIRMNKFEKYLYLDRLIEANSEEIQRLRSLAMSIPTADPSKEFIKGGVNVQSRFEEIIDKVVAMEQELYAEIGEYIKVKREIHEIIKNIDNPIYALVLRYRYIDMKTNEEIAEKIGCSVRHVYNLKTSALKEALKE